MAGQGGQAAGPRFRERSWPLRAPRGPVVALPSTRREVVEHRKAGMAGCPAGPEHLGHVHRRGTQLQP